MKTCKPILFAGPMVRAILDGRKSQTRRVVKEVPRDAASISEAGYDAGDRRWAWFDAKSSIIGSRFACRYGVPGDVLWVRESFWNASSYPVSLTGESEPVSHWSNLIKYAADGPPDNTPNRHYPEGLNIGYAAPDPWASWHLRPSIHMPYAACRLWLRVKAVRVERVEAITGEDAVAEGFTKPRRAIGSVDRLGLAREGFLETFYDLNKRAPRGSNPWVWVIAFERCEKPGGEA